MNMSKEQYDDFCKRLQEAWGADMTAAIESALTDRSWRLIEAMESSLLDTMDPKSIIEMLDKGQIADVRALAEKALAREPFVREIQRHLLKILGRLPEIEGADSTETLSEANLTRSDEPAPEKDSVDPAFRGGWRM